MMNYLWAGLILISFLFAIGTDANDLRVNRYHNRVPLTVAATWQSSAVAGDPAERVALSIPRDALERWSSHASSTADDPPLSALVVRGTEGGRSQLQIQPGALPADLAAIRRFHDADERVLVADVLDPLPARGVAGTFPLRVTFEPVRFVRLRAINDAAVTFAQKAFEVALGLVGGLALWMGLLKIAEESGLVNGIVRTIRPLLGPLFPDVPRDSPALGLIALNVAANMLALGNAATPIGIKAMQELQRLNPRKDTATNAMCMLLAVNTAGVTLLPSPSLVGIMGPRIGVVMGPILATTALSLAIAIVVCKVLERRSPQPEPDPAATGGDESPPP